MTEVSRPKYMTYIDARNPQFKLHDTIGPVKTGIAYHVQKIVPGRRYNPSVEGADCHMIAYELNGTSYDIMWDIPRGTKEEDLPWKIRRKKPYVSPPAQPKCPHIGCTCNT